MRESNENVAVESRDEVSSPQKGRSSLSVFFYSGLVISLLAVPFLMGLHINALGNAEVILLRIAIQSKLGNSSQNDTARSKEVPSSWWSCGCLYPLGGLVGALGANSLMSLLGRRYSSYVFLSSSVIGGLLKICSYWVHFSVLMLGRFFDGIGSAGLMVTSVVLMFELVSKRGAAFVKPLIQICVNLGILIIAFATIKEGFNYNYQYSFIVAVVVSIYVFFATFILPESPVWLLERNRTEDAVEALKKVHGDSFQSYYDSIKESDQKDINNEDAIGFRELFGRRYRGAIISTILLNAAQQLSGINCIMAFAPTILGTMKVERADLYSLIITSSALLGSLIFAPIVSLKKRKRLLIVGHSLMAVCMIAQVFVYHLKGPGVLTIAIFSFFVFIFQIAPGPLVWFICIEIFPPNAVSAAQSLGVASNWISNAIVFAIASLDQNIMIFFAIVNVFISVYLYFFVAETLKRSHNDILDEYEERFSVFKR